MLVVFDR